MGYRRTLWEFAAYRHGVFTIREAADLGVPAVEVRKLASRGALAAHGQGVYTHNDIPASRFTQLAVAVALCGESAFLQRESACELFGLGQFNPFRIRVGTTKRIRRTLPAWIDSEYRRDLRADQITSHEGIASTSLSQTLNDLRPRMPHDRWLGLVDQALRQDLDVDPFMLSLEVAH